MKKLISLFLVLVLCMSLCACGKSEAAANMDKMISAIGTVTLESEAAIKAAEATYNALTQAQKDELDNYSILVAARATLDSLLEQKANDEASAENQEQANSVIEMISAIGEVTADKADAIKAARDAYNALDDAAKAGVSNLADLESAETALATLQAENIVAMINSIGTVTTDSGNAISSAETAYNALPDAAKALVSNADVLTTARAEYNALLDGYVDQYLSQLTVEEDRVRGINFYYASGFPYYDSYWGADVRSFALPYMGVQGDDVWLRLVCDYTADDWIFFEKITFAVDDERYYKSFSYTDVVRDNDGGEIWEYVDMDVSEADIEMLHAIANSEVTIVRFEGDDYYDDVEISSADKKAIAEMLRVYEFLANK